MDAIDVIEILEELKDNAEELSEEKYKNAFDYAISAILAADMRGEFMEIIQEMLIKEFGEEWYNEFSEKVAKEKLRRETLEECYRLIADCFGMPPVSFTFEYRDTRKKYHAVHDVTPVEFYEKYLGEDLNEYAVLINAPTEDKESLR